MGCNHAHISWGHRLGSLCHIWNHPRRFQGVRIWLGIFPSTDATMLTYNHVARHPWTQCQAQIPSSSSSSYNTSVAPTDRKLTSVRVCHHRPLWWRFLNHIKYLYKIQIFLRKTIEVNWDTTNSNKIFKKLYITIRKIGKISRKYIKSKNILIDV